ncbi:MAG: hypothetical protein QOJ29_2082, partial [Thermoleophilaceae bacterium]|jgi:SAM-dependent methyltransferase|nr:hypothetical protein [Thermoleophilaceae bacterium]
LSSPRRRLGPILARTYLALYDALCGRHPDLRPWHFQWLAGSILYRSLRPVLATVDGEVLDVGCEHSPYRDWMPLVRGYVGLDVQPGAGVDVVVPPGGAWPLTDGRFDSVLCTQVLEHVAQPAHTLSEIHRVTRPGGTLILTVPFIYNEHGTPADYQRLTRHGVRELLEHEWEIVQLTTQGGVGSSTGILLLNWANLTLLRTGPRVLATLVLLPAWLAFCAAVNAIGALLDRIDRSNLYYGNVLVVATRRGHSTG